MSKFCPMCGSAETDDQSVFCRQCGNRFPPDPQENKGAARPAADLSPRIPPTGSGTMLDGAQMKKPRRKRGAFKKFLAFDTFITKPAISVIYCIGAVALTLVSVLYLVIGIVKPGLLPVIPTPIPLVPTTLFWILLLVFGNLFWRIFCELLVVMFSVNRTLVSIDHTLITLNQPVTDDADSEGYTTCPICSDPVRADELQKCDRCGVMGCKKCIRTAGLVKKTKTCKTCFEKK